MNAARPKKVISGGQTGVDRAALEVALALKIEHGGWCPRGRLAEDGPIPERFTLRETATSDYAERTERNVLEADATLILHTGSLGGGTLLTSQLAARHGKPCLCVDLDAAWPGATGSASASGERHWQSQWHSDAAAELARVAQWLRENHPRVLNVAGPRQSQSPGIAERARRFLTALWTAE